MMNILNISFDVAGVNYGSAEETGEFNR